MEFLNTMSTPLSSVESIQQSACIGSSLHPLACSAALAPAGATRDVGQACYGRCSIGNVDKCRPLFFHHLSDALPNSRANQKFDVYIRLFLENHIPVKMKI